MKSFAGVTPANQFTHGFVSGFRHAFFRFEHQVCSTFAKVDTGSLLIKGFTGIFIENFQGVESIEMKFRE